MVSFDTAAAAAAAAVAAAIEAELLLESNVNVDAVKPYTDHVIKAFGTDRCR